MHTPIDFVPAQVAPAEVPGDAIVYAWHDSRVLVGGDDGDPRVPRLAELRRAGIDAPLHYMGALDGVACVALTLEGEIAAPPGLRYAGLRALFPSLAESLLALGGRAFQIVEWDRTHRFCGRCGTPMRDKAAERARECPACGLVAYPRVSPAMMALVTRGRQLLLARARRFPPGTFSALAGFVEPGETIEDCLRREIREEVGIEVQPPVYFGSQSWAFPHSLMIAFTAEYAGGELRPDADEIEDARWFDPDQLPPLPSSVSISRRLIEATAARLRA